MDTISMKSKNSKTSHPHRLFLSLNNEIHLRRAEKIVPLLNLSIYYTCKNMKDNKFKSYKNKKFKLSAPTWNGKFELPDGSNPIWDVQDYFEHITQKHKALTNHPPVKHIYQQTWK